MAVLSPLRAYPGFLRNLHSFLTEPLTVASAQALVRGRLGRREELFLTAARE